jgi:hypothetical protein
VGGLWDQYRVEFSGGNASNPSPWSASAKADRFAEGLITQQVPLGRAHDGKRQAVRP